MVLPNSFKFIYCTSCIWYTVEPSDYTYCPNCGEESLTTKWTNSGFYYAYKDRDYD